MLLKRGKREDCGTPRSQARKKMKRTMLFTYFTTLASLVLCCAMFLGTTMAWFTSNVENTGNVIQVGTLAAGIYRSEDSGDLDLSEAGTAAFVVDRAWQPKNAVAETFKVVNAGDLDFTYELDILVKPGSACKLVDGVKTELTAEELSLLLSCFQVYVTEGRASADSLKTFVETPDVATQVWIPVGDLLTVVTEPAEGSAVPDTQVWNGVLDPKDENEAESCEVFSVGVYMKADVTAEVMGWNVELIVQLLADQLI